MAFDRDKFKSLVHYVCWKAGDPAKLGAIKLNKICWLADFLAFYETDRAITDARYVRRQFGPVPSAIQPVLRELQNEGILRITEAPFHDYIKREFAPLVEPDPDVFSEKELELIDWTTQYVCNEHTAASISKASHDHIWQAAADGEEIPYFTIFALPGTLTDSEREWAALQIEEMRSN
jgi:hypothetical protein